MSSPGWLYSDILNNSGWVFLHLSRASRGVSKISLRNSAIIDNQILKQSLFKLLGWFKSCLLNNFFNSAIEAFNHAICVFFGLIKRWCSMPYFAHSWSKRWFSVGSRSSVWQNRSVNSLPLSVRILEIKNGDFAMRFFKKEQASSAVFAAWISI